MTDLASISDEWWHGSGGQALDFDKMKWGSFTKQAQSHGYSKDELPQFANYVLSNKEDFEPTTERRANFYKNVIKGGAVPVKMEQPAYYKEHRNIVKLLENTGKSLLNEAKDQKEEATAMAKKLKAPNPFYHLRGGDYSWGGDEDVYLDPDGNHISKEDYEKQFENQDKFPVEPDQPEDLPEQPQFVGDPTQFKPMPFDPNNPMMYMGSGSPFYHLRGGMDADDDDEIAQFLQQQQQWQEQQDAHDQEMLQVQQEILALLQGDDLVQRPVGQYQGGAKDKYLAIAKLLAKKAGYKDWDSLRRASDGDHKLELRGVKFGRKDYGDFIKYSLEKGMDEAKKHRDAYLARATKIRGDWAKDMYSPNSLAIKILWGGGLSGGGKTEAELEAMSVVKLIEYGKSLGVKGLDGKTKKVIMDKIISHEKTMPESTSVAPKEEEGLTPLKLYKMLLMEGHLEKDLIPLAKKQGIQHILHKNKKTLVNEIYDNLLSNEEIQASDSLENVPKVVMYIFGKGPNPYPDSESEEEEESDEEEDPEEIHVTRYVYDTNPYLVENERTGLAFKDRRVFDPVADNEELGTLGEMPEIAKLVEENETVIEEPEEKRPATPTREEWINEQREQMVARIKSLEKILDGTSRNLIDPHVDRPYGADRQAKMKKDAREDIKAITEQLKRTGDFKMIEGEPLPLASLRITFGEDHPSYKAWVQKFKKGEGVKKWEYPVKGSGRGKPTLAPQDVLEGKKDNPVVEETIEEPMDDQDIRSYFPNAKVMRYSGLARLSDIEQLLPTDKSYVFLLYEQTPGSGHWVALMRYGKTIEFFCSYGSKIDAPLRWNNPRDNAMLGQTQPYLSMLLNKAKGKFRAIYNPVAYQSKRDGVATCGAWDVMRINQLKNHNQDLHEFHEFMESVKKETGLTYDEIVVNYVSKR
jgi:hypothetical protein